MRPAGSKPSFWFLAVLLGLFLFAASAPSPLYGTYAKLYHFSSTTVTAIYAVYASGALAALLTSGRLSDHLGRRPVVMLALVVQIAGMVAFIVARGVGTLYAARVLQGIGTGIASGAISAWLLDLQPPEHPRLGSLVGGIALLAGLATGALGSGLLAEYGPDPLHLVFWLLIAVYAFAFVAMFVMPDVVQPKPGWLHSMIPQVGVPQAARTQFVATTPSLVAIWALAALYLSLGPALAISLVGGTSRLTGALVIFALCGAGAAASAVVHSAEPRSLVIKGSLIVVVGVGVTLLAVMIDSSALLYAGSVAAGLGLGPAFSGIVRTLGPPAPPEKRGALFASLYIVVYVSISVPAVIAGVATSRYGLRNTTYAFGLIVMTLAAMTTIAISRSRSE